MNTAKPLWNRLFELHGKSHSPFVEGNRLAKEIAGNALNWHGGLLSTAERFAQHPALALDWAAAGLQLHQHAYWKKLRDGCLQMMGQFFANRGNAAAWIHFEGCRDPLTVQAPELRVTPWATNWNLPSLKSSAGNYEFRSTMEEGPKIILPRKSLVLVDAEGNPATGLAQMSRTRQMAASRHIPTGMFDTWCAADPERDKQKIENGWVPAGFPLRVSNQLHTGMLIDWVALDHHGMADMFTLELHPQTAEIVSIRSACVPIETVFRSQSCYHGCIAAALGENPDDLPNVCVLDETLKARLKELVENPRQVRFDVIHCFNVLRSYIETNSLHETGIKLHVGDNKGARERIENLQNHLKIDLFQSQTSRTGRTRISGPAPVAQELAAWFQSFVMGQRN